MNQMQMKLENPQRLAELKPEETLKKIGFEENMIFCDIGAGSGVFSIPAAKMTKNTVYALDINEDILSLITEKAKLETITNIETVKVDDGDFKIAGGIADIAMIVTVLHEIKNKEAFLAETKRILNGTGKIAVIEFYKHTQNGPPAEIRIGKDELADLFEKIGFSSCDEFDLGENLYCMVFEHSCC